MRFLLTVLIASLMGAAVPALAQAPAAAPANAKQETTAQWHHKLLAKYNGQLNYLDADGKPITAQAFMAIVEARSAGFKMTEVRVDQPSAGATVEVSKKLTLQVLKPGATS